MDFLQRAAEYFKNHLSIHTFHITSDGMAFAIKTDAEAHARTLTDKEVKTILRTDVELKEETAPKAIEQEEKEQAPVDANKASVYDQDLKKQPKAKK